MEDRIRRLIRETVARIPEEQIPDPDRKTPLPGDLYTFDTGDDGVGIEWLVVQHRPDDGIVLLAPVDDFPLLGTPDVNVVGPMVQHVRCGETDWFPDTICDVRFRCTPLSEQGLKDVQQMLADMVRGRSLPSRESVDCDPEYEEWLAEVRRARHRLGST